MRTLRQLLSEHPVLLVLDTASTRIQAGVLRPNRSLVQAESREESGVGLFEAAESALAAAGETLDSVQAFVFCDGPGSVLGIRTAAVALRTWRVLRDRRCYAYGSLELVAATERNGGRVGAFTVIADARRETWHRVSVTPEGRSGPLQRVRPEDLNGPLLMPADFRFWSKAPPAFTIVAYDAISALARLENVPLLRDAAEPDAFLHEEPVYQTWTPQIHRAPS